MGYKLIATDIHSLPDSPPLPSVIEKLLVPDGTIRADDHSIPREFVQAHSIAASLFGDGAGLPQLDAVWTGWVSLEG